MNELRAILASLVEKCIFVPKRRRLILSYKLTHRPENAVLRYGCPAEYRSDKRALYSLMVRALEKFGLYYEEFLLYECGGKDDEYLSSFVSEIGRMDIYDAFNGHKDEKLFHDKYAVYKLFSQFYKRDVLLVEKQSDRNRFLAFAKKHGSFFVKPVDKSCGCGVRLVKADNPESLFDSLVGGGRILCEQQVEQCCFTSQFNPTSLNTVRIVTVVKDGKVHIYSPFFRCGRYGKNVDNAGSGGVFTSVDAQSGKLGNFARDEGGNYYTSHPDSHIAFAGKFLPRWDEAISLAKFLALVRPDSRIIGWDLALADDGWVMIEANFRGQFLCQQMTAKPDNSIFIQ